MSAHWPCGEEWPQGGPRETPFLPSLSSAQGWEAHVTLVGNPDTLVLGPSTTAPLPKAISSMPLSLGLLPPFMKGRVKGPSEWEESGRGRHSCLSPPSQLWRGTAFS